LYQSIDALPKKLCGVADLVLAFFDEEQLLLAAAGRRMEADVNFDRSRPSGLQCSMRSNFRIVV
jgi:hypothetical protein